MVVQPTKIKAHEIHQRNENIGSVNLRKSNPLILFIQQMLVVSNLQS